MFPVPDQEATALLGLSIQVRSTAIRWFRGWAWSPLRGHSSL